MLNKKSVDDINVKGKKVLVRCDFNVPLQDGKITDENRLVAALPTIKKLIADGGKVILCSHLGKPKGEPKPELSLAPVAVRLSELLGQEVKFAADPEVVGPNAKAAVAEMKDGDVVLLENTRYRAEETKNEDNFSKELASLADVFVNDAFGTAHRAHCSNVGVTKYVDTAVVGYLMQKEIDFLGNAVNNPERPFVAILGGAKVSSKIPVIENLLDKVDTLIIGGGMAYTFMAAHGEPVGKSLLEEDYKQYALDMEKKAEEKGEPPFIILLDNIEDPHNLGAIIRTANLAGAHGVIIPKHRAVGLTATVAKTSAGALNYTPVAKVANLGQTIDELKEKGIWFVCADMDGEVMYRQNLTGPIGLVIGNEGNGVSRLVKEKCDFVVSMPMYGKISSLNASVAAGLLMYEVVRQRHYK